MMKQTEINDLLVWPCYNFVNNRTRFSFIKLKFNNSFDI